MKKTRPRACNQSSLAPGALVQMHAQEEGQTDGASRLPLPEEPAIFSLPPELMTQVIAHLTDIKDLYALITCCKYFLNPGSPWQIDDLRVIFDEDSVAVIKSPKLAMFLKAIDPKTLTLSSRQFFWENPSLHTRWLSSKTINSCYVKANEYSKDVVNHAYGAFTYPFTRSLPRLLQYLDKEGSRLQNVALSPYMRSRWPAGIVTFLPKFKELRELDLNYLIYTDFNYNGEGNKLEFRVPFGDTFINEGVLGFSKLTKLYLNINDLTSEFLTHVGQKLPLLKDVRFVGIDLDKPDESLNLTEDNQKIVFNYCIESMQQLRDLEVLCLSKVLAIRPETLRAGLHAWPKLEKLLLAQAHIGEHKLAFFECLATHNPHLKKLHVLKTSIVEELDFLDNLDINFIAQNFDAMESLDIACLIAGNMSQDVQRILANKRTLSEFSFVECISIELQDSLPLSEMIPMGQMQRLDLRVVCISESQLQALLTQCTQLTHLYLDSSLVKWSWHNIRLTCMPHLKVLSLAKNSQNGRNTLTNDWFKLFISKLPRLECLDLSFNSHLLVEILLKIPAENRPPLVALNQFHHRAPDFNRQSRSIPKLCNAYPKLTYLVINCSNETLLKIKSELPHVCIENTGIKHDGSNFYETGHWNFFSYQWISRSVSSE